MNFWYTLHMNEPWRYMLSKEARHKKPYAVWFHLYEMSRIGKSRDSSCLELGKGYRVDFRVMEMFWNLIMVKVPQLWEYTQKHWIVHFCVNLTVYTHTHTHTHTHIKYILIF